MSSSVKGFVRPNSSPFMKYLNPAKSDPYSDKFKLEPDVDRYQRKIKNPFLFELEPEDFICLQQLKAQQQLILKKREQEKQKLQTKIKAVQEQEVLKSSNIREETSKKEQKVTQENKADKQTKNQK